MTQLTIGKLADVAGVPVDTVRFYERAGLLKKATRTRSGYRLFDPNEATRLRFIRRAKALGFSLEDIAELLRLNDGGGRRSAVRKIAEARLAEIAHKLSELRAISRTLRHLVNRCDGRGDLAGCPIIEAVLSTGPRVQKRQARHTPIVGTARHRRRCLLANAAAETAAE